MSILLAVNGERCAFLSDWQEGTETGDGKFFWIKTETEFDETVEIQKPKQNPVKLLRLPICNAYSLRQPIWNPASHIIIINWQTDRYEMGYILGIK